MRVTLVSAPTSDRTAAWVTTTLRAHHRRVDLHRLPTPAARGATQAGHRLRDGWALEGAPDVILGLDWPSGVAAHVAARETEVPVVVRLARVATGRAEAQSRLEVGLARSSRAVLVPSVGQMHRLADRGAPRDALRVLPEPVDRSVFSDVGAATGVGRPRVGLLDPTSAGPAAGVRAMAGYDLVALDAQVAEHELATVLRTLSVLVVLEDSEEAAALTVRAMACGVPVVALDQGLVADLVADGVTGRLVRPGEASEAMRSLLADPMGREAMGLAALDRVRARFDLDVVGPVLVRLLAEAVHPDPSAHPDPSDLADLPVRPDLAQHLVALSD